MSLFHKKSRINGKVTGQIKEARAKISSQISQVTVKAEIYDDAGDIIQTDFPLKSTEWIKYNEYNVHAILCSLNNTYNNLTIINCKFEQDGFIPPLKHDRIKTMYVIDGEFTDTVNNKIIKKGEVYRLEPDTLHSIKSDDCLVTITWEPAY